jgi:putative spermidine/putrescine transport system permease protein
MSKRVNWHSTNSLLGACLFIIVVLFFAIPVILLVISSFGSGDFQEFPPAGFSLKWYARFFQDPSWSGAFLTSINLALEATLIVVPIASLVAYFVERTRFPGRTALSTLLILPALLPIIVYAVAFVTTFASWVFFDSWIQIAVAHAVLGLPLAFLIMRIGISSLDREIEEAARTLGAGPLRVTVFIRLPWLKWHLIFSAFLTFVVSFTEPVMPIFLTSDETATLPQKAWEGLLHGVDPRSIVGTAFLVFILLLGIAAIALLRLSQVFLRRSEAK